MKKFKPGDIVVIDGSGHNGIIQNEVMDRFKRTGIYNVIVDTITFKYLYNSNLNTVKDDIIYIHYHSLNKLPQSYRPQVPTTGTSLEQEPWITMDSLESWM